MPIHIYNSLTQRKEELVPLSGRRINMYTCGVTVYDRCHLGHARSLYIFDVLRRYMQFRGFEVRFVRNITDIDDKIINNAHESGRSFEEVVNENLAAYEEDLARLGVPKAQAEPRATHSIADMVEVIARLIERGVAYEVAGDVYFSVRKFPKYGELSGQSVQYMEEAVRIEQDPKKRDPLDFALWKKSKPGEPAWPSPWGAGRPGWHIECTCMSLKYLGCETLDIHAGGRDLIFPHHENERAQAEALTGKPFSKYWIHHGLLTIGGHKMAKSSGNFITIEEALKKYRIDAIKFFFLSSHYSSPIDFTEDKMQEVQQALSHLVILNKELENDNAGAALPEVPQEARNFQERFIEAMDDDFNTAKAMGCVFDFIGEMNKRLNTLSGRKRDVAASHQVLMKLLKDIFGLFSGPQGSAAEDLTDEARNLLEERLKARAKKDYAQSDQIREELKALGIIVEDKKDGQRWRKA